MDYKENIKNEINILKNKIEKQKNKLKIYQILYRFVAILHVGSAGSFSVNALKDLLSGNIFGIFAFLGLIASAATWYFIFEAIQKNIKNKLEKQEEKLFKLEEIQKQTEKNELSKKRKQNLIKNKEINNEKNILFNKNSDLTYMLKLKK